MKKNKLLVQIEKITQGNSSETNKLIEILIRQTSEKLALLKSCDQESNWKEIKKIAHFLKSNFIALKMQRAIRLSEYLRREAGDNIGETKNQLKELYVICTQIIEDLGRNVNV